MIAINWWRSTINIWQAHLTGIGNRVDAIAIARALISNQNVVYSIPVLKMVNIVGSRFPVMFFLLVSLFFPLQNSKFWNCNKIIDKQDPHDSPTADVAFLPACISVI